MLVNPGLIASGSAVAEAQRGSAGEKEVILMQEDGYAHWIRDSGFSH